MPRNRVIYQSEALFVGPSPAISGHFTDRSQVGPSANPDSTNLIKQLHRVQTANYAFNIARTDINQFGELAAIDRVILDSPTVSLDFSYILAHLQNEKILGFIVDGQATCIKKLINKEEDEKNYFIETVGEGRDAFQDTTFGDTSVIGIGNGFITSYTSECSVGNLPTVSINVEGLNMAFNAGVSGTTPAIHPQSGIRMHWQYLLPKATGSWNFTSTLSGVGQTSSLRPGDMVFQFRKIDSESLDLGEAGVTGSFPGGPGVGANNSYDAPGAKFGDGGGVDGSSHAKIQSYNLSLDMGREPIQKLGSRFAFTREITFPITATLTIEALVADLLPGSLSDLVNCDDSYDIEVNLLRPTNCAGAAFKDIFVQYRMKNAKVNSQAFSSDIGSNKSVTIEFSTQIGGPNQVKQGLFMSGLHDGFAGFVQETGANQ